MVQIIMKRWTSILVPILLIGISACNSGKNLITKANRKFDRVEFEEAIKLYQQAIAKKHDIAFANYKIGESFRKSNRLGEALPFYKKAINGGLDSPEVHFHYAYALKVHDDYSSAKEQLNMFVKKSKDKALIKVAKLELENLASLNILKSKKSYFKINSAGSINTAAPEYSPFVLGDTFYFTSARDDNKTFKTTGTPFSDLYYCAIDGKEIDASTVKKLEEQFNTTGVNEGTIAISPDGNTMIFARGTNGKRRSGKEVNLFISRFRNGAWSEPKKMLINEPDSWDSSPCFSRNGKTLYFASNRKGGKGGIDIYSAKLDGRGRWARVKNLGKSINTPGDELFPYVTEDGKMYFSSDGHPGFGGLDLFVAIRKEGKTRVQNLGKPMNSPYDDLSMYYINTLEGFFASNRPGGAGDDDIYYFYDDSPELKIVNYFLEGITYANTDSGKFILPNTKVRLTDVNEVTIAQVTSDDKGYFKFEVDDNREYLLIGEQEKYFTDRRSYSTMGKGVDQEKLTKPVTTITFKTELVLERIVIDKSIVLQNIYYDLDKDNIREDAAVELDRLAQLLIDNPYIKIELSSHTDVRAPDDYNMDLSQRRAESAVNYLISKGIAEERMVAKGYGETKLIIPNAETEEQHQKNRRTEFKVTEIDNSIRVIDGEMQQGSKEEAQINDLDDLGSDDDDFELDMDED